MRRGTGMKVAILFAAVTLVMVSAGRSLDDHRCRPVPACASAADGVAVRVVPTVDCQSMVAHYREASVAAYNFGSPKHGEEMACKGGGEGEDHLEAVKFGAKPA